MKKIPLTTGFLLSISILGLFSPATALQVQNYQGIAYVTGGIGVTEREALNAMAEDFNLKLRFAVKGGSYTSAVHVLIQDARNTTVLEAVSDGPWFLVALKPGSYTVVASDTNETLRQQVQVPRGRSAELIFRFQDG